MVTIKLGEIRGIVSSLNKIMNDKLPVKAAYSLSKLGHAIQKEFEVYEEGRLKLIERYCARGEDAKPVIKDNSFEIADREAFGKELSELANIEAEIDFTPIGVEKLGDIQISPAVMTGLDKFITGD